MNDRTKVSAIARRRKSASCSDFSRSYSPKYTLFFPFRGLAIGANLTGGQIEAFQVGGNNVA